MGSDEKKEMIIERNLVRRFAAGSYGPTTRAGVTVQTKDLSFKKYQLMIDKFVYNPSDLVGRKGLDVYDKMLINHSEVKAAHYLKIRARLAQRGKLLVGEEHNEEAKNIKDFVQYNFDNIPGGIHSYLRRSLDATRCGYKVSEEIWHVIPDGPWKGLTGLRELKTRNSKDFAFEANEYGDIIAVVQDPGGDEISLPPEKFAIAIWGATDDDAISKYGKSDFEGIYSYYWCSVLAQKLWMYYLEKFTRPVVVGKYERGTDQAKVDEINESITNLFHKTATSFSKDVDISLLEPDVRNIDFKTFMDWNNSMIRKGLLVGDRLIEAGDKGSYALSKVQFDSFLLGLEDMGRMVEDVVNEQIIKRLVGYNFQGNLCPIFKMPPLRKGEMDTRIKLADVLLKNGAINPHEKWFREWLDIPERGAEDLLPGNEDIHDWYRMLPRPIRERLLRDKELLDPVSTDDIVPRSKASGLPSTGGTGEPMGTASDQQTTITLAECEKFGVALSTESQRLLHAYCDESIGRVQNKCHAILNDLVDRFRKNKLELSRDDTKRVTPNVGELSQTIALMMNEAWLRGIIDANVLPDVALPSDFTQSDNNTDIASALGISDFGRRFKEVLEYTSISTEKAREIDQKHRDLAYVAAGSEKDGIARVFKLQMLEAIERKDDVEQFIETVYPIVCGYVKAMSDRYTDIGSLTQPNYWHMIAEAYLSGYKHTQGE